MPFYTWIDHKTGYKTDVIRSFKDYEIPPQDEDLPEDEQGKEREWERLIGEMLFVSKWPSSTGPVKGRP